MAFSLLSVTFAYIPSAWEPCRNTEKLECRSYSLGHGSTKPQWAMSMGVRQKQHQHYYKLEAMKLKRFQASRSGIGCVALIQYRKVRNFEKKLLVAMVPTKPKSIS